MLPSYGKDSKTPRPFPTQVTFHEKWREKKVLILKLKHNQKNNHTQTHTRGRAGIAESIKLIHQANGSGANVYKQNQTVSYLYYIIVTSLRNQAEDKQTNTQSKTHSLTQRTKQTKQKNTPTWASCDETKTKKTKQNETREQTSYQKGGTPFPSALANRTYIKSEADPCAS